MRNPFKWHRIGWTEGRIEVNDTTTLTESVVRLMLTTKLRIS